MVCYSSIITVTNGLSNCFNISGARPRSTASIGETQETNKLRIEMERKVVEHEEELSLMKGQYTAELHNLQRQLQDMETSKQVRVYNNM